MWAEVGGRHLFLCLPFCAFWILFHVHVRPLLNLKIKCKRKCSPGDSEGEPGNGCCFHPLTLHGAWPVGTCPSVDAEKHSVPVFDCSQMVPYTGSRWLNSIVDNSATRLPFRVSQQAGRGENEREVNGVQAFFPGAGSRAEKDAAAPGLAGM